MFSTRAQEKPPARAERPDDRFEDQAHVARIHVGDVGRDERVGPIDLFRQCFAWETPTGMPDERAG